MPTVWIHTGPQAQERDGHYAAYDRPALERFGMVGQTFWAGHRPLLSKKIGRRVPLDEKDGTSKIPGSQKTA